MHIFKRISLLPIILAAVLFLGNAIIAGTGADSGRDSPVILSPSDNTIRIDTVKAFPYPDTVVVPVYFTADTDDSICQFEFELSYPENELSYVGYNLDGAAWSGNIIEYNDAPNLEIQGVNGILAGATNYILVNLLFAVDELVGFEQTMNLTFHPDVYFKECQTDIRYDPNAINGSVETYGDSLYAYISKAATGYSYQALDTSSIYKRSRFVEVPILMYASFPCSEFQFWLRYRPNYSDSSLIFAGYAGSLYGATAEIDENDSTLIRVDNIANPQTFNRSNAFSVLRLRFRVGDFHEIYNDTCTYSGTIPLIAYQAEDDYFKGADSEFEYSPDSSNYHDGAVKLPQYKVRLNIFNSNVASDSTITVPVQMRTTFWSQYYKTYIKFDSTYLHLDSATSGYGYYPVPEHISYTYESASGSYLTYKVQTDSVSDNEYISANSNRTIFYLHFTPTAYMLANLGCSTQVSFNTLTEVCEVRDYFPPEDSLDLHIYKYSTCCDSTFVTTGGYVKMPVALVYAEGDVDCIGDSATVPLHIDWIGNPNSNSVNIIAVTTKPLRFRGIVTSGTDFKIDWGAPIFEQDDRMLIITGTYKQGEVDESGILLKLAMAGGYSDTETPVDLDLVRFFAQGGNFDAATEPGWVNICEGGKDQRTVIPTVPAKPTLIQNHPNPFNAITNIEFNLVNDGLVTIDIYDIMGRKVKRLISEEFTSGSHRIIWDCRNQSGDEVCSGFYIYTLYTDEHMESKKMLLLK